MIHNCNRCGFSSTARKASTSSSPDEETQRVWYASVRVCLLDFQVEKQFFSFKLVDLHGLKVRTVCVEQCVASSLPFPVRLQCHHL